MKHRIKLAAATILISFAGLGLMVVQNWRETSRTIVVNIPAATLAARQPMAVETVAPTTQPIGVTETPTVNDDVTVMHTAVRGETVDSLATDLRNKETKSYRDAILDANPSLKANPDKLIAGKTYLIPAAADVPAADAAPVAVEPEAAAPLAPSPAIKEPAPAPTAELKYTAKAGDTVSNMAGSFLGNADKAHQDTITNANASLKSDPDHVVAGKAYKIPVTDGLTAAAAPAVVETRPAVQPDADTLITAAAPKTLRYTAKAGDTVTSMAIDLLGSNTLENRNAIINTNPSLKRDPDRVVAGETYSIPAPMAPLAAVDPR